MTGDADMDRSTRLADLYARLSPEVAEELKTISDKMGVLHREITARRRRVIADNRAIALLRTRKHLSLEQRKQKHVYFFASAGLVKIGVAKNVESRLADIIADSAEDVTCIGVVHHGGHLLERQLHIRFTHLRERNEWFFDCEELRHYISAEMDSNVSALTNPSFDYSSIGDKEVRCKLINLEGRIRNNYAKMLTNILDVGEDLHEARNLLANHYNGTFQQWVPATFGFSKSTAYNLINVFLRFGDSRPIIGRLCDTTLYLLSSPLTPESAVKEAKKLATKGVVVTPTMAKEIRDKHLQPAAPRDERAKDRHATTAMENGTDAGGGDPIREDEEDPDSCLDSGLPHKWISDGNGDRYCETCKVDHPDNDVRPDPRETAVKHLTGIAATLVQARINFSNVCQDLGSRPASYDQIMADADKALVSIRRWAKELLP